MPSLLALNPLNSTDIVFFIVLAVLVALCIVFYFLVPILNKAQYQEMRDNLKKREDAFKSNVRRTDGSTATGDAGQAAEAPVEVEEAPVEEAPAEPVEEGLEETPADGTAFAQQTDDAEK